jgi:hypothetical protein
MDDFEDHGMSYWRFEQYHKYVSLIWQDKSKKETDEWRKFIAATDEFNERRNTVAPAAWRERLPTSVSESEIIAFILSVYGGTAVCRPIGASRALVQMQKRL